MQMITLRALNKRMPLRVCMFFFVFFFANGHGPWEFFFRFLSLLFLLYLYTPCGSFFFNFFFLPCLLYTYTIHKIGRHPSLRKGMSAFYSIHYTTRLLLLYFFCLSTNPTHKFRIIFFYARFFFGRKKPTETVIVVTDFFLNFNPIIALHTLRVSTLNS